MKIVIAVLLPLLVVLWLAGRYARLRYEQARVRRAWAEWEECTHCRNAAMMDFAALLCVLLPSGDLLPRTLRRLAEDSERTLKSAEERPRGKCAFRFPVAETVLRRAFRDAVETMEGSHALKRHERLQRMVAGVNREFQRQDAAVRRFYGAARRFNDSLRGYGNRTAAWLFGYTSVGGDFPARQEGTLKSRPYTELRRSA